MFASLARLLRGSSARRCQLRARARRLNLESLEDRCTPATFIVTNTLNAGPGSLRAAIATANSTVGADTIAFDIPGPGPHTISPLSALPAINEKVTIDGSTEPDFAGTPIIELSGNLAGNGVNGLVVNANETIVRWLNINQFRGSGIRLQADGSFIQANVIGLTSGGIPAGNNVDGVTVLPGSENNRIGTVGLGNQISGNRRSGITLTGAGTTGNLVLGNVIGANTIRSLGAGNGLGVWIVNGAASNSMGGTAVGTRNIISGNVASGVAITGAGTNSNALRGNWIGVDAVNGLNRVGNGAHGVWIANGASSTIVGGPSAEARNVISGNGGSGVQIEKSGTSNNTVFGNYIGLGADGATSIGNSHGVTLVDGATNNVIGGTLPGSSNTISGNLNQGVVIQGAGTSNNRVEKNRIGTNPAGNLERGNGANGVRIFDGASNNTIGGSTNATRNLISGNANGGVSLAGSGTSNNTVIRNYIGTDVAGTAAIPNEFGAFIEFNASENTFANNVVSGNIFGGFLLGGAVHDNILRGNIIGLNAAGDAVIPAASASANGIFIGQFCTNNVIGGSTAADRNIISGFGGDGIEMEGNTNRLQGNYIGTDVTGAIDLGNGDDGIRIRSSLNQIGGTAPGERNVVSGNNGSGIQMDATGQFSSAFGNVVEGNHIGVAADGISPLGNTLSGVHLSSNSFNNRIGGTLTASRNIIAHNGADGVLVTDGFGNSILGNLIFANGEQGIDLGGDGITANDEDDGDTGPNNLQNFALVQFFSAEGDSTLVVATLNSSSSHSFRVEFFAGAADGDANFFLGYAIATTNNNGDVVINFVSNVVVTDDMFVMTTVTDLTTGDTSELSAAFIIL